MTGKVFTVLAGIAPARLASAAGAEDPPVYRGRAKVVGPAMLSLSGTRIGLYGVDALVKGQPCKAGRKTWDCATASAKRRLAGAPPREGELGSMGDPAAFIQHMPSIEFEDMPPPALPPRRPF